MKLGFGKYHDIELENVFHNDPQYCAWLVKQEYLIDDEMKQWLEEKLEGADLSYRLRWGKHKNKTLAWIKEHNPNYLDWLRNNAFVQKKCSRLAKELELIREETAAMLNPTE